VNTNTKELNWSHQKYDA